MIITNIIIQECHSYLANAITKCWYPLPVNSGRSHRLTQVPSRVVLLRVGQAERRIKHRIIHAVIH